MEKFRSIFYPTIALFLLFIININSRRITEDNGNNQALSSHELPEFITKEILRHKRAIPVGVVTGLVKVVGGALSSKFGKDLKDSVGSNITKGFVKDLVKNVMNKILNVNHMEDIHKQLTKYLDEWSVQSDKQAAEVTTKLKSVFDELVKKNQDMLKSKAKINIIPQKGMDLKDMFVPAGYKIETSYASTKAEPDSSSDSPYSFDSGVGNVIINGCYEPSFSVKDPCHAAKRLLRKCDKMLDGANFIGVGFDGRGEYSSTSRRRSLIQRICLRGGSYDQRSVPDSMTVHGIYDTDVKTMTFSKMAQYQQYLESKSAVAKSGYMFMDAVTKAYGKASAGFLGLAGGGGGFSAHGEVHASGQFSSSHSSHSISQQDQFQQMYMSLLQVDVARYEIFLDEVKPHDLNMDFLHDFAFLPTSYFAAGAPLKFQNFILRYGTHYIKSAKFGGSLRLFKVKQGSKSESIEQFATKAQSDYKAMFSTYMAASAQFESRSLFHKASAGGEGSVSTGGGSAGSSESSAQGSNRSAEQQKYSNEVLTVEGGDQAIAAVISEMYTVGFKHELVDWLRSIPTYPKPIEFQMAPISDLCNINYKHLFPSGVVDFGCFAEETLLTENGTNRKYYLWKEEAVGEDNATYVKEHKHYCDYQNQQGLEDQMRRRCKSLKRGIDVYLEEGPVPVSDIHIRAGRPGCETNQLAFDDIRRDLRTPSWAKLIDGRTFKVIFDMPVEVRGVTPRSSVFSVFFRPSNKRWYVKTGSRFTHLYDGYGNGGSSSTASRKISIRGMVLSYNEVTGLLLFSQSDYDNSKDILPDISKKLIGHYVARVEYLHILHEIKQHKNEFGIGTLPCSIVWSNAHRFNPAVPGGRCISFAGISEGDIFVVFSAIPRDRNTWYYVQISPNGVAIYKGTRIMKFIDDSSARGLGDNTLFQLYFVCVRESLEGSETTILYGKTMDSMERGHVYGAFHDTGENLHVRFYAFGNGDREVDIMDAHVLRTSATGEHVCVGDTIEFEGSCVENCHPECKGCHTPNSAKACHECKNVKFGDTCVAKCPDTHTVAKDGKTCICKLIQDRECVYKCNEDRVPNQINKDIAQSFCVCRFYTPREESVCLPGCPLTTYSEPGHNGQTKCLLCHAGCVPQDEDTPVCLGKSIDKCTECYKDKTSCIKCLQKHYYLDFSKDPKKPVCKSCPAGSTCPGDGRKYECSWRQNQRSLFNKCVTCPKGQYSTIPVSGMCHKCPPGRYKKPLSKNCIQCHGNTAGPNCKLTCKCVYGRCIKIDGKCSCYKFFSGTHCDKAAEGALRLVDDRVINKYLTVINKPSIAVLPQKDRVVKKIEDTIVRQSPNIVRDTKDIIRQKESRVKNTYNAAQKIKFSFGRRKRAVDVVPKVYQSSADKKTYEKQLIQLKHDVFNPILRVPLDFSGKIRGRLEIYHNGQWGSVCGKYWTQLNTKVACRQFYYSKGVAKKNAYFGQGKGPIWITRVTCHGLERSLNSCPKPFFWAVNSFISRKVTPCRHSDDIGLMCY